MKQNEEEYQKYVKEFITELKTAKYWLKNDGNPKPEWKLFETRNAAREAVWEAARDAAWFATAARDAAHDAARDAAVFAGMIVCLDLEVELKHLLHLNAMMEVWRKGYGLLCDVDGVLYVYKRSK